MASKVDESGKLSVFDLKVPLPLALGHLEKLTDTELHEQLVDLMVEINRRKDGAT